MGFCSIAFVFMAISNGQAFESENLKKLYSIKIDLDYLRGQEKKLLSQIQIKGTEDIVKEELLNKQQLIAENEKKIKELESMISQFATDQNSGIPQRKWISFEKNWRIQKEKLVIKNPESYALNEGRIVRTLKLDLAGTTDYQLGLVNKAWTPINKQDLLFDNNSTEAPRFFEATIKCDSDFKINKNLLAQKINKGTSYHFRLYEQSGRSPRISFQLNQKIKSCEIFFNDSLKPESVYGVRIVNDSNAESSLTNLQNRFEACLLPDASHLKGMESLFLTPHYSSMTCPEEIQDMKTLEEPIDGLKAKAETLLGQELSDKFITDLNPYAELDFSRAPKLNTILISYLVFRHDFYGTLLARLAKWHADHGTQVRIMMSDVIANKKDRHMLYELVENSNNIKIQEYKYISNGGTVGDHFSQLHRTMHVKLLITLSDNPKDNVVYIGGRNIHDGFVFMEKPDHSALPDLVQYGSKKGDDEAYAPWRDYEMRIRSKGFAEQVASHYMTLWQKDSENFYIRSINQNIVSKTPADSKYFERAEKNALIRHFISIPYKDDAALEKFYVDIFDHAEKSVRISTPYFRPTKIMGEAMNRAVARGVKLSLITRIDFTNDTAAFVLNEVNKAGINQFLNKFKIDEYIEPGVIIHSKIVLVDDKVSFIGSVNFNKRSFIHDTENFVMIYNSEYNKKMHTVLDTYLKKTKEVTKKQKVALWKRIIINVFDEEF